MINNSKDIKNNKNKIKTNLKSNKDKSIYTDLLNFEDQMKINNIDIVNNINTDKKDKKYKKNKKDKKYEKNKKDKKDKKDNIKKNIHKTKSNIHEGDKTSNFINNMQEQVQNLKQNPNKNFHQNINPLIANEIIWYSDDLDSVELEQKFSEKFKPTKNNLEQNDLEQNDLEQNNLEQNDFIINLKETNYNFYFKPNDEDNYEDNKTIETVSKEIKEFLSIINYPTKSADATIVYLTYIDEIKSIEVRNYNLFSLISSNVEKLTKNFIYRINETVNNADYSTYNYYYDVTEDQREKLYMMLKKSQNEDTNRLKKTNIISSTKIIEKIIYKIPTMNDHHSFTQDYKNCLLPCVKINNNIFKWDENNNLNYSSYKLQNYIGMSFLDFIIFIKDGKKYSPEKVDFYIGDSYIKTTYKELVVGSESNKEKKYNMTFFPFPLIAQKIKIIITDVNEIDQVLFSISHETVNLNLLDHCLFLQNNNSKNTNIKLTSFDGLSNTSEILYEGIESDIKITDFYGYYTDIRIVCENIKDNIKNISCTNTDITLLKDIPIQLLIVNDNIITCTTNPNPEEHNTFTGFKIDQDNQLEINLEKKNPNANIKIYGNKLILIDNYI